ncbi:neutral zinc metallopeptidase [Brachybacterium huguangmaarense]|uniref:Neutral zinc metallopeptidase n=1 Tax=Brachybacterium huguangmaarense TaxID=1652028 RepID=A0ABY6G2X1_9MICO|nr:neutral zinc metallopeptidase [Brachybacterium huguangmaarense]UYG17319.1 neutral zinc metallopeptidase [Brachybacterium huguangmaarense]
MEPRGRHLATGAGLRQRHPALVLCAALLVGCVAVGVVGIAFLHQLRAFDAPYRPGGADPLYSQAPVPPEAGLSVPPSGHESPAWSALTGSPLTRLRVTETTDCDLPALRGRSTSRDTLQEHLTALAGCLDRQWAPVLTEAGLTFEPVSVVVFDPHRGTGSACGGKESAVPAVYCPSERTIYVSSSVGKHRSGTANWTELTVVSVLGHEYGHHLQSLTGVLDDADAAAAQGADGSADMARRIESMATCLGALSHGRLGGAQQITQGYYARMIDPGTYRADASHGSAATQAFWAKRGYDADGDTSRCATFSAPAEQMR